jgi:hypothetical protein
VAGHTAGQTIVFLISLKAGGVGLNLTSANHVILMDPWWNPAVEEQACDRVHRLGQTRPVSVARFVAAGTIEERMTELQELKRQIMQVGGYRATHIKFARVSRYQLPVWCVVTCEGVPDLGWPLRCCRSAWILRARRRPCRSCAWRWCRG